MSLETGNFISDLVAANPLGTDPRSDGDDHIRLLKSILKTTFPNINAAVSATPTQIDYTIATPGTVSASKALIVDASSKLDVLNVDNLVLNGNTISAGTGAITITPAAGSVLNLDDSNVTVDGGVVTVTGQLDVDNINLNTNTVSASTGALTLSPAAGSVLNLDDSNVTVDGGVVTVTGQLDVDNLRLNGNALISTDTNGDITLTPNGSGVVQMDTEVYIGNTSGPDASAVLELESTTLGFLPPRMTTTQRDAVSSPAEGLLVHNTTTNVPNFYSGSAWTAMDAITDLTTRGDMLRRGASTNERFALGTANTVLVAGANDPAWGEAGYSGGVALPTGYKGGLVTSVGTDTAHDVDITAGMARDIGDAANMVLTSALTKQIDATWALGTDAGGLDTGAVANDTAYCVYLIRRSDTGVVDALFSTDMSEDGSSVTMPTNYDQIRRIGWVLTNGSANIYAFIHSRVGAMDYIRLTGDIVQALSDATLTSSTFETATLPVPPLSLAHVYVAHNNASTTALSGHIFLKTKGAADAVSGAEAWTFIAMNAAFDNIGGIGEILTSAASQVEYAVIEADGTASLTIHIIGIKF